MENIRPPFKIDIAGTFLLPQALKEAREQYRNEQISLVTLRAMEDAEIRNLVERLKSAGLQVVTDGRFRNAMWPLDFMWSFEGVQPVNAKKTGICLNGRIDFHHHPVIDDFMFLTGVTGGDVIAKQVLPAPSLLLSEVLKTDAEQLDVFYEDRELLVSDISASYCKLIQKLYDSGCRYIQFDDSSRSVCEEGIALNNLVLEAIPADLYVSFHASVDMLSAIRGVKAFFLDYDDECCGRTSLLWFIKEQKATFGFIPSHYPMPDELDEIYEKIDEVTPYIALSRLSLCVPNAQVLPNEAYETALKKQWTTIDMAMIAAKKLWGQTE